jgi:hypothetical protein
MAYPFGVRPPEGQEWQIGKTAATIQFVRQGEEVLSRDNHLSQTDKVRLKNRIQALKKGDVVLLEWQDVGEYLKSS